MFQIMGCVYKLTNRQNGMSYVGQVSKPGKTLEDRLYEHIKNARNGCMNLISCAIREFSIENFDQTILASSDDIDEIDTLECAYIKQFDCNASSGGHGYNMTAGGQRTFGFKWSEKSCDKKRQHCVVSRDLLSEDLKTMTWADLTIKYKVSCLVLRRWTREFGLVKTRIQHKVNNQHVGKWTSLEEEALLNLYLTGLTKQQIASALNRSLTAIDVKLARLKKLRNVTHRRFRNQHQCPESFTVKT